ncbi:MAG: hypothetical protein LBJ67_02870 [Planctomycetaceae bacterium]|nr:hypothetical protein [Planctomycetaceae bacterium]
MNHKSIYRRNSRRRCPECHSPLRAVGYYPKSGTMMIIYRVCTNCGKRWKWEDKCVQEVKKVKSKNSN